MKQFKIFIIAVFISSGKAFFWPKYTDTFLFLHKNIFVFGTRRGSSNEYPQHVFVEK